MASSHPAGDKAEAGGSLCVCPWTGEWEGNRVLVLVAGCQPRGVHPEPRAPGPHEAGCVADGRPPERVPGWRDGQ